MDAVEARLQIGIAESALLAGVTLTTEQAAKLARHVAMVYEAGERTNLTRVPRDDAVSLHVIDSLMGLSLMLSGQEGPWADLGAGAGFPGVPLSIVAERHIDLIEANGKKARFLEGVARRLRLDAAIREVRAETAAAETPRAYAALCARALGSLPEIAELAAPLLCDGGVAVAWKGPGVESELERGRSAAGLAGLTLEDVRRYELPGHGASRTLVVFRKVAEPKIRLPRRPGMAHKRPLA